MQNNQKIKKRQNNKTHKNQDNPYKITMKDKE